MRRIAIYLVIAMEFVIGSVGMTSASNDPEAPPTPSPFACAVTEPNASASTPTYYYGGPGSYQNEALWTNLWMWGEDGVILSPADGHISDTGAFIEMKWAWYRFKDGELTITGRRLDAPAPPLEAWIPGGYGSTGFQVSGITFPTTGCWEVTGHLGEDSLTFVVRVAIAGTATPYATPSH